MPSNRFQLGPKGTPELIVGWKGYFNDVRVTVSGQTVLQFANRKALKRGQSARLPDGRILAMRLAPQDLVSMAGSQLDITVDGQPVQGSAGHPDTKIHAAIGVAYVIATATAALGILGWLTESEFLAQLGFGWPSLIIAAAFAALGRLAQKGSIAALGSAGAIVALDTAFVVIDAIEFTRFPVLGLLVRVAFLAVMIQGVFTMIRQRGDGYLATEKQIWLRPQGIATAAASLPIIGLLMVGLIAPDSEVFAKQSPLDRKLTEEFKALSAQLPMAVDKITQLEAAWLDDDEVHYRFRLPNQTLGDKDKARFQARMSAQLVVEKCNNASVRLMLDNNKTVHFAYVDQPGSTVAEILIEKAVCSSA